MLYNLTYITKSDRKLQCLKIVKRLVKHIADSLKCFIFAPVSNYISKDFPSQSFIDCYTSVYKTLSAVRFTGLFNLLKCTHMNDFFSQTFVYAVQCYNKVAHVCFYVCFYSSRDVAKEHCKILNENQKLFYYKVKKVTLFHSLIINKVV